MLSRQSRKSNNYQVFSLGTNDPDCDELLDSLIDKRRTSVPDQAAFRVDFPRWFAGQSNRDQRIINRLSQSCTTSEVASEFQISAGRVSQLRREFADSWEEFHASTRKGTEIHHKPNFQPHNMKELSNA